MAERRDCAPRGGLPRRRGPTGTRSKKGVEPTVGDAILVTNTPPALGSFTGTRSGVLPVSHDASRRVHSMMFGTTQQYEDGRNDSERLDENDESYNDEEPEPTECENKAVIHSSIRRSRNRMTDDYSENTEQE